MKFCFYPPRQPQVAPAFLRDRMAAMITFGTVCAMAILFAAIPFVSLASDSRFPDFPPAAPARTGADAPKLPAYSMAASPVEAKPVAVSAVGTKPVNANTTTNISTVPTDSTAIAESSAAPKDTPGESNTSTNPMDVLDDEYKLAPGDTVNLQVLEDKEDPDNNGEAQAIVVTDSGDVEIPYVGRYPAAGKTCLELARQLKGELEKKYYYQATVIISVKSMTSKGVIYVMGGVRSPGPMELPRDDVLTVSKAILRAGGFDDFADQKHVQVTRKASGTNAVFTVNVSAVLDKSKIDQDRDTQPGDFIYVPEKTFRY
jgi:protein involved in polysaccharide export with SLBB domain